MNPRELLDRYEALGDSDLYETARALYEQAIAHTPGDARLLHDYGYLHECHGRRAIEAAVVSYERALELEPGAEKTRLQLLHALAGLGRHREAIERCRRWLAERPDDVVAHRCLAYAQLAARRRRGALAHWREALRLDPENLSPRYSSAFLLEREGRRDEAAAEWRSILAWCDAHDAPLDAQWARRELARLSGS